MDELNIQLYRLLEPEYLCHWMLILIHSWWNTVSYLLCVGSTLIEKKIYYNWQYLYKSALHFNCSIRVYIGKLSLFPLEHLILWIWKSQYYKCLVRYILLVCCYICLDVRILHCAKLYGSMVFLFQEASRVVVCELSGEKTDVENFSRTF